jgi:hypothetical protein
MRLRSRQRHLVIFRSSDQQAGQYAASPQIPSALTGRIRRCIRIGTLVAVIVVRPRWKPLLTGTVLTIFGIIEHSGMGGLGGMAMMPGLMMLWAAALTPGDSNADHHRRQQLMRELAAYSTSAQRRDLEAVLDRYPDGVTGEIREILASQGRTMYNAPPGPGRH